MAHQSDYSGGDYGDGHNYDHGYDQDDSLSGADCDLMDFALGSNTGDSTSQFAGLVAVALLITLLFVLMSLSSFDHLLAKRVSGYSNRLLWKSVIFFFIVFVFLWAVSEGQKDRQEQNR